MFKYVCSCVHIRKHNLHEVSPASNHGGPTFYRLHPPRRPQEIKGYIFFRCTGTGACTGMIKFMKYIKWKLKLDLKLMLPGGGLKVTCQRLDCFIAYSHGIIQILYFWSHVKKVKNARRI
jgi:hypothetical protein